MFTNTEKKNTQIFRIKMNNFFIEFDRFLLTLIKCKDENTFSMFHSVVVIKCLTYVY